MRFTPRLPSLREVRLPPLRGRSQRPGKAGSAGACERALLRSPGTAGEASRDGAAGRARHHGFTLIELLVALAVMALLAIMSWRGLDGMARAEALTRQRADELLVLHASLGQWRTDLDALAPGAAPGTLDWDGRLLRLTRRGASLDDGLRVVAWTRRVDGPAGRWQRWQSPALRSREAWAQAWSAAQTWAQAQDPAHEVSLLPLDDWQIFYYRDGAWSHPLSSDGSTISALPDGIRLVLSLPPGQAVQGQLTLDWISPTVGGGKS